MRDVIYVAVILGFFALAAAYVRACTAIIGRDDVAADGSDGPDELDAADSAAR